MPSYTARMKVVPLALLSLACLAPTLAGAEWQWLDKDGRRVFSDQAPPADIAPNRILKQGNGPRGTLLAPAAPAPAAAAAAAPASASGPVAAAAPAGVDPSLKPSGKDRSLEEKRRQAEAAEAKKKKDEETRLAALRADNCSRARSAKIALDSGQRVAVINDKGEREIMDDKLRAAEAKRLDDVIARDCRAERQ